ncbi:MAG: tetratricopeptide repeat protein [Candidatus Baltobacteraceae bacterium]
MDTGAFAQAELELSELLARVSDLERVPILNKRGISRVHLGRRQEALADFNAALQMDATYAPSLVNVGNLLLEDGRLDEAIAQYEKAVRSDDEYAVAHMNLSAAYKKAGRHDDAVREFRRAGRVEGSLFKKKKPR